ncbi:nucleotidyltransferase family protein [Sulfitobacter sp. JB4-11]|uniref:nucleotidyltransferase family protein n=1 Tax=Sulfitobacter rhodophyticola TaxID=3238304 RepID=UPI003D8162DD
MTLPDLPILLLAAGASARMQGRDKLMEDVDGQPLIRRQAQLARAATSGPVIITLPPPPHPRYSALEDLEILCLPVPDAATGIAASIRTGVAALPPDTQRAMICLADLPDLTTEDLITVARAAPDQEHSIWRGATADGRPGHPIVFDQVHFPALAALTGDRGARNIIKSSKTGLIPLPGTHALNDLDTPEDWAAWRARQS